MQSVGSASGTNYERLLRARTGAGHLIVTEFAGDLDAIAHRELLASLPRAGEDGGVRGVMVG